jgi:hypothetical protein
MLAEVTDTNVVRQLVLDELARGVGQKNLTTVTRGTNARAPVDAHPDISLAADEWLSGMEPHPYANRSTLGPGLRSERALSRYRGGNRVSRAGKRNEERVALRVDLVPVELFNRGTKQPRVRRQNFVVPVAELLQQPR